MTLSNEPTPKKKLKKWHIAVLVFVVFPLILMVIGMVSPTPSDSPAGKPTATASAKPTPSKEPAKVAQFSAELTRWETLNPASGRAVFTIRNVGEVAGSPGSCYVEVKDVSGTYKGFDWILLENTIEPGTKFMGNVVLKVTKEGAAFITNGNINCG